MGTMPRARRLWAVLPRAAGLACLALALTVALPGTGGPGLPVAAAPAPSLTVAPPAGSVSSAARTGAIAADGSDFQLIVPSLAYRSTVREGTDEAILGRGPGHYETTAWPGLAGNVGIAAHNTFWLAFARLKPGDLLRIQTRHGLYEYAITGIRVVEPDDRTALAPTQDHRLTLTTGFPLDSGAAATQRLVFSAIEVAGAA